MKHLLLYICISMTLRVLAGEPNIVAVIDTGIDTTHPELRDYLWRNPGETGVDRLGRDKTTNGIDDDKNGFVDDVYGWNFADKTSVVSDNHGHGTHISGLVVKDLPKTQVKIMTLKYFAPTLSGSEQIKATIEAIHYAAKMGARVINFSAGGGSPNKFEYEAIELAKRKNILFVTAAGNESFNSDRFPYYPANYDLTNILAVASLDSSHKLLPSSNYGTQNVEVADFGKDVVSTLPGGNIGTMTGTSQATAVVTNKSLQILLKESLSPEELILRVKNSGNRIQSLIGKTQTGKQIDVAKALKKKTSQRGIGSWGILSGEPTPNRAPSSSFKIKK